MLLPGGGLGTGVGLGISAPGRGGTAGRGPRGGAVGGAPGALLGGTPGLGGGRGLALGLAGARGGRGSPGLGGIIAGGAGGLVGGASFARVANTATASIMIIITNTRAINNQFPSPPLTVMEGMLGGATTSWMFNVPMGTSSICSLPRSWIVIVC
ncbi:MAG: hypothetical protein DRO11_07310 [Methanobacteriota archaeon]|nr:MAG: hypothetical protein DRO11_07310 [Euryarchaeota archaeon]